MEHSFEEVHKLAHALPEEQRIQLANSLYESVATDEEEGSEAEITAAWDEEIRRRLDEIDSGAVEMIPGDQVRAELMAKLSPEARARLAR